MENPYYSAPQVPLPEIASRPPPPQRRQIIYVVGNLQETQYFCRHFQGQYGLPFVENTDRQVFQYVAGGDKSVLDFQTFARANVFRMNVLRSLTQRQLSQSPQGFITNSSPSEYVAQYKLIWETTPAAKIKKRLLGEPLEEEIMATTQTGSTAVQWPVLLTEVEAWLADMWNLIYQHQFVVSLVWLKHHDPAAAASAHLEMPQAASCAPEPYNPSREDLLNQNAMTELRDLLPNLRVHQFLGNLKDSAWMLQRMQELLRGEWQEPMRVPQFLRRKQ